MLRLFLEMALVFIPIPGSSGVLASQYEYVVKFYSHSLSLELLFAYSLNMIMVMMKMI